MILGGGVNNPNNPPPIFPSLPDSILPATERKLAKQSLIGRINPDLGSI